MKKSKVSAKKQKLEKKKNQMEVLEGKEYTYGNKTLPGLE